MNSIQETSSSEAIQDTVVPSLDLELPADIPEDDEIMFIGQELEHNRIFTPPPRIAARFYRPPNNRRKSSATSSRRNSMSSAHSKQSHVSGRSLHRQSNAVAQHLRKASIIEDRKARLADRAAHAEKVRLRAALAKAAPRTTVNFEERALAAQQAREKNLAEIVANCGEEVKRAKQIAKSMREKSEADNKKLRREMEDRLAEAQKRREDLLNKAIGKRIRGSSLTTVRDPRQRKSPSPTPELVGAISQDVAATRIQNTWRAHRRLMSLRTFSALGLSIEGVREVSFETVTQLLAQEKVLISTAEILQICGLREGAKGSVDEMTAVRTFLSAYLILGHPTQVLSNKSQNEAQEQVGVVASVTPDDLANPQLQDLVAKARDLLISFEFVLSRLSPTNNYTPPPLQLNALSVSYAAFYKAFIAWKARDSSTLIDMMILQFVELDSIWQTVQNSTEEAVTESYREGIRNNQVQLMVRIKRLAGDAHGKKMIASAIRESRKNKAKKSPTDSQPRAADVQSSHNSLFSGSTTSTNAITSALQVLTPPATPTRSSQARLQEMHEQMRIANSVVPDNRIVVHELSINREYRFEIEDCLDNRSTTRKHMLECMRRDMEAGKVEQWVPSLATQIKIALQKPLSPGTSLYTMLEDNLDPDLISQELSQGNFSYQKLFVFVADIMPKLCAPFRDEQIRILQARLLQEDSDLMDKLEVLMHSVDCLQLDYANFLIQRNASLLIRAATEYEHRHFAQDLEDGIHTLSQTEKCWSLARSEVLAETARRDPESINLARSRPTPDRFYAQMLMNVFTNLNYSGASPETLRLNARRIRSIKASIRNLVTAAAALYQAKNLMKRDFRNPWKTEASRILNVLENSTTAKAAAYGIQVALESTRSMPAATKDNISTFVHRITENAYRNAKANEQGAASSITDPVMRTLLGRLTGHIMNRLNSTSNEKDKMAGQLSSLGFSEFVTEVDDIAEELRKIGTVDRDTHGQWYELIEQKMQSEASSLGVQ